MASTHKLIMTGAGGVGKSALTLQFMYDDFVEDYEPTKADSYRRKYTIDGEIRIIDILDTAGQEDFMAIRDIYYRSGEGFMLVFSVSDASSFKFIEECKEAIIRIKGDQNPPMLLVGNKCDLSERQVQTSEAEAYARTIGVDYIETSAKNNLNVNNIFETLTRLLLKKRILEIKTNEPNQVNQKKNKKKRFRCTLI